MSLEKAIKHGKERRKQYRGAKANDTSCRNHGGCPYCESGRKHATRRQDRLICEVEVRHIKGVKGLSQ
jgi:hypothetical protein